jgi:hypothetical protein
VEIGEYRGVVRVPWRVFQRLLPEQPTPERCVDGLPRTANPVREHRRADANWPKMGMWESAGGICAKYRVGRPRGASQIDPNRTFGSAQSNQANSATTSIVNCGQNPPKTC